MLCSVSDIEAQILEIQGMKAALLEEGEQGVGLDSTGFFDQEIYGGSDSRFTGYVTSIAANEQEDVRHLFIAIIMSSENNCKHLCGICIEYIYIKKHRPLETSFILPFCK